MCYCCIAGLVAIYILIVLIFAAMLEAPPFGFNDDYFWLAALWPVLVVYAAGFILVSPIRFVVRAISKG